jgi:FkbM family methyltransferase
MLIEGKVAQHYLQQYGVRRVTGVLHVGAHTHEEQPVYDSWGVPRDRVVWIDAVARAPGTHELVVSDTDGEEVDFHLTNNDGQSSSILPLGTHMQRHPHVHVVQTTKRTTTTLDTFFSTQEDEASALNFWNLDIQGAELKALRGATGILQHADAIYLEVNTEQVYKGCAELRDVEAFLQRHHFQNVYTVMTEHGWGDALFIRPPVPALAITLPVRAPNRVRHITAQNIPRLELVTGVDGLRDLTFTPVALKSDDDPPQRQRCVAVCAAKGKAYIIDHTDRHDYAHRGPLSPTQVGCAVSHLEVYARLLRDRVHAMYLVLEDDAKLRVDPRVLETYLRNLPPPDEFDVALLNSESQWYPLRAAAPAAGPYGYFEPIAKQCFSCAASYIITRSGAARILEACGGSIVRPADDALSVNFLRGVIQVVKSKEYLFTREYDNMPSTIDIPLPAPQAIVGIEIKAAGLGNKLFQLAYMWYMLHHAPGTPPRGYVLVNRHLIPQALADAFDAAAVVAGASTPAAVEWTKVVEEPEDWVYMPPRESGVPTLYKGFFQCQQYVHPHLDALRAIIRKALPSVPAVPHTMFLHIRLRDYVTHPFLFLGFDRLATYYKRALGMLPVECTTVLIFTDDVALAREKFAFVFEDKRTRVAVPVSRPHGSSDMDTLAQMAACSLGGIIANSTFSWWAAALLPNPTMVIAPRPWSAKQPATAAAAADVYLPGWMVVHV